MFRPGFLSTAAALWVIVGCFNPTRADPWPESYVVNGAHGTGWYHNNTPADQVYGAHKEEPNIYIFDFGVTEGGSATHLGHDSVDIFDANFDKICFFRTQSQDGSYIVTSSADANGMGMRTGSAVEVTFFAFDSAMNATALGTLSIDYWIAKYGHNVGRSHAAAPFLPAPGCH